MDVRELRERRGVTMSPDNDWWRARRTWLDVFRCVLGQHRPALTAWDEGRVVQRCTCGAFGPAKE